MADHDARLAALLEVGAEAEAERLEAEVVQFGAELPARVVLAKAGGLDQGRGLIGDRVGDEIGARAGEHARVSCDC